MSSYMQMGHDTENLVGESGLEKFTGIIFSPVNRGEAKLSEYLEKLRSKTSECVFDPQLYFPLGMRGALSSHSYYPSDFDTADTSDIRWWQKINTELNSYAHKYQFNCVTTPASIPRVYSDEYYDHFVSIGNHLRGISKLPKVWLTVLIDPSSLSDELIMKYASILSKYDGDGFYVVFESTTSPRREYSDPHSLTAMMKFIRELKNTQKEVIIAFSSSEMALLKCAGADGFGTGKFFNLRRFSRTRFEEEKTGGRGMLPYLFEENLFGFLREADIASILAGKHQEILFGGDSKSEWSDQVLVSIYEKHEPWVKYGWRQYLAWFSAFEQRNYSIDTIKEMLKLAESRWAFLSENEVLFEEPANDGSWIRPWRVALQNFSRT